MSSRSERAPPVKCASRRFPDAGCAAQLVSNLVSTTFARRLAEHDVGVAESVLLRELFDRADMSPSEIADANDEAFFGALDDATRAELAGWTSRGR